MNQSTPTLLPGRSSAGVTSDAEEPQPTEIAIAARRMIDEASTNKHMDSNSPAGSGSGTANNRSDAQTDAPHTLSMREHAVKSDSLTAKEEELTLDWLTASLGITTP